MTFSADIQGPQRMIPTHISLSDTMKLTLVNLAEMSRQVWIDGLDSHVALRVNYHFGGSLTYHPDPSSCQDYIWPLPVKNDISLSCTCFECIANVSTLPYHIKQHIEHSERYT